MKNFQNILVIFTVLIYIVQGTNTNILLKFSIFANQSFPKFTIFEGEDYSTNVSLNISIINGSLIHNEMVLKCRMDCLPVGELINWTDLIVPQESQMNFNVNLKAKRLGGSKLICSITKNNSLIYEAKIAQLIVKRKPALIELIFKILIILFVVCLTFVMGCGLDIKIIIGYVKNPVSPFIGFCCQFVLMPLISAGLAIFTKIDSAFGLGLLVIGCSPGGGGSNIWTILFGGDLNLSMTMTFISTCAALFMMPLWMFALGRFFIDPKNIIIPYGSIVINLLQIVIPAVLGMGFRWKWENKAKALIKRLKLITVFFIIFLMTFGTYANLFFFKLLGDNLIILPIGAMLPWLGFFFGLICAIITRRSKAQMIAISLETGFQNIGIAMLILIDSIPQPEGDLGAIMTLTVAIFTPFPLYLALLILYIKKRCFDKNKKDNDLELKCPINETVEEDK